MNEWMHEWMNQWINQFACLSIHWSIHPIYPIRRIYAICPTSLFIWSLIATCATFLHSVLSIHKSMLGLYIYVQRSQNESRNCTHPPQKKSTTFSLEVKKDTPESVDLKLCLVDAGSAGLLGSELRTWSSRLLDWRFSALDLGLSEHGGWMLWTSKNIPIRGGTWWSTTGWNRVPYFQTNLRRWFEWFSHGWFHQTWAIRPR